MSPRPIGEGTCRVIQAIRQGHRHGADIMEATGQGGGTVYKVLRRLEQRRLIEGRWEDAGIAERERRPRRRYYRVTPEGEAELFRALARQDALTSRRALGTTSPERSR